MADYSNGKMMLYGYFSLDALHAQVLLYLYLNHV
jgi:hypothetical protein